MTEFSAQPEGPSSPVRRAVRGVCIAIVIGCVVLAAITLRYFVFPANDLVTHADAVVVLSGDHGERLPVGLRLVRAGIAPVLVLDGQPDLAQVVELCKGGGTSEVVCLRPDPDGTRPEAEALGRLAATRGWRSVVVVTSTQHGTRAGVLLRRCVHGSVQMVRARPPFTWRATAHQVVRELAATAYVLIIGPHGC